METERDQRMDHSEAGRANGAQRAMIQRRSPQLQRLIDAVKASKYAGDSAHISQNIAHQVVYAAWRYVQLVEDFERAESKGIT